MNIRTPILAGVALALALSLPTALRPAHSVAVGTKPNPPWQGLPTRTTVKVNSVPGDPINVALEGSKSQVLNAFTKIGWVQADPLSPRNDERMAVAALHHGSYPHAPVSKQYLFGRVEDFAVEHELGSVASRDHARFWDTGKKDSATHLKLWIGGASKDIAIMIVRKHGLPAGTTHRIDGNLDAERNLIAKNMQQASVVDTLVTEPGIGKTSNGTTGGGSHFSTDGKVDLLVLK